MNHLISVRTNIMYAKVQKEEGAEHFQEEEYKRFQELIFLVDKPEYRRSTEGEIIRERGVDEVRFVVSDKVFDELLKILAKLKNSTDSDLV